MMQVQLQMRVHDVGLSSFVYTLTVVSGTARENFMHLLERDCSVSAHRLAPF
jgi:hypothetical protein